MGKIAKMTPHLANMIAAGEVVEKPSSVVKELVENAIDANAKSVSVFLQDGGLKEIKIVDDGDGMDKDDVEMAFLPHATSKIKNEYDLFRILSLGFRGEAIASIAAVSNMKITSSQDGLSGFQVTYNAGMKRSSGITNSNKGTTVTVQNLFFNTPARLKYLKPAKNELGSIAFFMDKIALAHPEIRFTLENDGKRFLSTTASSSSVNLMGEIYSFDVAKNLINTEFVIDGVKANLVLVKPEIYRANKLEITIIINGRYVKNYNLTNAIIEGYNTYLPIGKYPICVVYLDIDPLLVDVNVHPSKTEVKIANEIAIANSIKLEISKALKQVMLIPERKIEKNAQVGYEKTNIFELPKTSFNENITSYEAYDEPLFKENLNKEENIEISIPKEAEAFNVKEEINPPKRKLPYFEYVGQAFGTYLIFQNSDGLYLIDQHAAAERVNYEKYYQLLGQENQPTTELLVPIMLSFTKSEMLFLEQHLKDFQKLGFELELISNQDYIIRQIPLWANLDNATEIVREIFSLLIESKNVSVIYFRDKISKQISCKASIKANHFLGKIEIDTLIENLNKCENPYTCPHGRPTLIKLSQIELEKMFERIQS